MLSPPNNKDCSSVWYRRSHLSVRCESKFGGWPLRVRWVWERRFVGDAGIHLL